MRIAHLTALVAVFVLMPLAQSASACTCMPFPADAAEAAAVAYPQADAVFVGRVASIKSGVPGTIRWRTVTFDVVKVWKGVTDDVPVVVRTAANSAACGYSFKRRETYLVFAYRQQNDDTLTTNLCALNMPERDAEALMRELDKVRAAASESGNADGVEAQNSERRPCPAGNEQTR